MHCTFGCHVPLSFQQQSVTNTVKSVENLASAKNARKSIQSKTANVNVSPPFYMVVRFKLECYHLKMHYLELICLSRVTFVLQFPIAILALI